MEQVTFQQLADELMQLYAQGKYAEALRVVEQNGGRFPEQSARTTYWKLCLLSLCGRADEMFSVFQQGLDAGLWWAGSQFEVDTDFDPVRDLPEFKRLVAESDKKCIEMQAEIEPERTILVPVATTEALPLLIALHGRNGNKESNLEHWEVARLQGWLVLSPQSRQALFPGSYCWDNPEKGLADILFHVEDVRRDYHIDAQRILVGGFSQGSGMAIQAALARKTGARGFIGVGTFIQEPEKLLPLARQAPPIRGYFVTGEKDRTLDRARAVQKILKEINIPFEEQVFPELGHEFPPDFGPFFEKAIDFIFKENE